ELERHVKVVFDGPFMPAGHKDHLPHPGGISLLHGVLDQGLVDDRQHLLRLSLGGWQKARAETRDGEDGFVDQHTLKNNVGIQMRDSCTAVLAVGSKGEPEHAWTS